MKTKIVQPDTAKVIPSATFISNKNWRDERPKDLVVCCSDGRYHPHIEEFVDDKLNIPESDLLVIPGGPHALQLVSFYPKARWATKFFLEFLAKHHPINRIVLIAHEGCAWYRSVLWNGKEINLLKNRQQADLVNVLSMVKVSHSHVRAELYYAHPFNGHVAFEKLD